MQVQANLLRAITGKYGTYDYRSRLCHLGCAGHSLRAAQWGNRLPDEAVLQSCPHTWSGTWLQWSTGLNATQSSFTDNPLSIIKSVSEHFLWAQHQEGLFFKIKIYSFYKVSISAFKNLRFLLERLPTHTQNSKETLWQSSMKYLTALTSASAKAHL